MKLFLHISEKPPNMKTKLDLAHVFYFFVSLSRIFVVVVNMKRQKLFFYNCNRSTER